MNKKTTHEGVRIGTFDNADGNKSGLSITYTSAPDARFENKAQRKLTLFINLVTVIIKRVVHKDNCNEKI